MSNFLTVPARVLIALLVSATAHASGFAATIESMPMMRAESQLMCEMAFLPSGAFEIVETRHEFEGSKTTSKQARYMSAKRSKLIDPIVNQVLDDWVDDRDFTSEQKRLLWGRDQSLDPRRTQYIQLQTDGHNAMLRIFDGSQTVLAGGDVWKDATNSDYRTPIELSAPGFILPEHRSHKPLVELSLLNVDRALRKGVETLLSYVAGKLDMNYNNHEFRTLGRINTIAAREMMVYAQTRANRVEILKRYGFQPVLAVNSQGVIEPFQVSPNLVLMYFKADEFIRRYYHESSFAETKTEKPPREDQAKRDADNAKMREHITRLENDKMPIRNIQDVANEFTKVFQYYVAARAMTGGWNEVRKSVTIQFFEDYYRLIASIPEPLRGNNWLNLRNGVREMLSQANPQMALYYFARGSSGLAAQASPEDFARFYATPAEAFKLGTPTKPGIVLSWTPQ